MRWVFYSLLVVNAVFLGWQQIKNDGSGASVVGSSVDDSVESIKLLSELGGDSSVYLEYRKEAEKCDVYGPFFSSDDSRKFLQLVKKVGIKGRREQEQINIKPYYWLYVAPLSSLKKAKTVVNRLRGYQLTAEIISGGRLNNGVSLGNFESRQEIERLQQRLSILKLELKKQEKSRDYSKFWVLLNPGSESLLKGEIQDRLIADFPEIFHQQKVCKPVA